ncbi:MAG: radical SAM protein [Acidobacteria bacterium]|nr:radical SAM protein [Acidobacteriota bacterium]
MSAAAGVQAPQLTVLQQKVVRALDNRILKLTLMPTEKCNFRCTYCYEDFALGRMPRKVVDGLKNLMSARAPELRVLDLRWFGGEPMLGYPVVEEICRHALDLRARHPRMQVVSSMTTNAYLLTRAKFLQLLDLGVRFYQISLDGYGEDHDQTRQRADGSGSFDRIWSNLLEMRSVEGEFGIMLRVHFTPRNLPQIRKLVEAINQEFGHDSRFKVFFKAITRLGGPNNELIERTSEAWQNAAKAELTKLVRRRDEVIDPNGDGAYICYAAEPNSFVIRSNGQIARCTVAFDDPRNQVGRLKPDGTLELDLDRSRLWFAGLESLDKKTLHCPLPTLAKLPPPLVSLSAP